MTGAICHAPGASEVEIGSNPIIDEAIQIVSFTIQNRPDAPLPLEHVRVATPQQFQSMLEFETCERVDFVVNVRCCKNSVRLTTIVEMLNMLFTVFAVRVSRLSIRLLRYFGYDTSRCVS